MIAINDPVLLSTIVIALALGGTLKGAMGMGSPIVAVPVMASFFDVRLAVIIMVIPNLVTNAWQCWVYRKSRLADLLRWNFAVAGAAGAFVGTIMLANFPSNVLKVFVASAVLLYVTLRLSRPDFAISLPVAKKAAVPLGVLAGILQGAAGISAPVSASFLNAMKLPRETFIHTISMFFFGMTLVQLPMLIYLGLFTWQLMALGTAALLPLFAGIAAGVWLAKLLRPEAFDRLVLLTLSALAFKLLLDVVV